MISRCHIHTFRLYAVVIAMLTGLFLVNYSVFAQTDPATSLKNWLEANQHESWGTWGSSYALIPYSESPSTTLDGAITSGATTLIGVDFSAFDNEGYIYVGATVETAEIMEYIKTSSTALTIERGRFGTTAVAHSDEEPIIFQPICETSVSQLATLTAVKALLQLDPAAESESVKRAVSWIETQDFRNTEYVARQIEVLSMAGRNCDAFIEKLMAWQNATDQGWGETDAYHSNAVDTAWAIRALLVAGYRNNDLIGNALATLLVHSSYDVEDEYVWSTYRSQEDTITRKTSAVITATVYETLMAYEDYLDDLLSNFSTITEDCEEYLWDQLTDTETNVHEQTIIADALKRFDPDNEGIDSAITDLVDLCEEDNNGKHYLNDPYLTALILNAKAQPDSVVSVTGLLLRFESMSTYYQDYQANISEGDAWQSAKFFYKTDDSDRFILYDSKTNTSSSTTVISDPLPYRLDTTDLVAVWIDNRVWAQVNFALFGGFGFLEIYDKDIKIYDNEGNIIPNNILLKGEHTSVEVRQKIYNVSPVTIVDRSISFDNTITEPYSDTITIRPYETQVYSHVIDISSQSSGAIDVTFTIPSTISIFPHSSHTQFYIVDSECTSVNSELSRPENLQFRLLENNTILLFWEPPLDPNVVGYQIGYVNTENEMVFFEATLDTSVTHPLPKVATEFRVFAFDTSSFRSSEFASVTVDCDNDTNLDNSSPYVAITSPDNDQIISTVRIDETDRFGSLTVYGSVLDDTFRDYKVELIYGSTTIDGVVANDQSCVSYGVLATFDLNDINITSGVYTLRVTARDLVGNPPTSEEISITIYKWTKVLVHEGNGCSSPTVSPNSAQTDQQLIYSSYQFSSTTTDDGYVSNLWHYEYDDSDPVNTQLTDTYTNDMEPDWFADNKVLFTSYRTGVRNLVIRDNESTVTERMFNVLQTTDGTYQVEYESVDLIDEDNEQVLFPKSFYNPDCTTIGNKRYIVSSDELGELVLLVDNDTATNVYELTHDLQENDGKTFLLADKPSIKITGTVSDYQIEALFEGYSLEPAQDYQNEDFYINSDIYYLETSFSEQYSGASNLQVGNTVTGTLLQGNGGSYLFVYGPYVISDECKVKKVCFLLDSPAHSGNASDRVKFAIYKNNGAGFIPIGETEELTFDSLVAGWNEASLNNASYLNANDQIYLAQMKEGTLNQKYSNNDAKFHLIYSQPYGIFPVQLNLPNQFNENLSINYSIYIECQPKRVAVGSVTLKQLTDTKYESETSPVWLGDYIESIFGVNISYVSDKDCNNDGIPEWNVYFAKFDDTATQSPYLSLNTPITNAVMNDNDGIVYSLDFNNGTLAFDEEIYLPESEEFRKRIWYLKMEQ